jgi:hypothetical protein
MYLVCDQLDLIAVKLGHVCSENDRGLGNTPDGKVCSLLSRSKSTVGKDLGFGQPHTHSKPR